MARGTSPPTGKSPSEQLVTVLARLCATDGELDSAGSDLSAFADGDMASDWSRNAFAWAAKKGLVEGYDWPLASILHLVRMSPANV